NFQLINCRCERRLNLNSILVTEFVPAAHVPDKNSAICLKFPNRCIRTSGHTPFSNDAGISASGYDAQQGCRSDHLEGGLRLRQPDSHGTPVWIFAQSVSCGREKSRNLFFLRLALCFL